MELAVFSGKPAFAKPIPVGFPIVEADTRQRFHALMDEAFDRNYLTNDGPLLQRLESEIASLHGVAHCAIVCNATIAQMLSLQALGLEGEVILPSFTFIATAHACLWQNLTPVFCDITEDTLTIDPDQVETLITPRTRAVIGVHLFGNPCQVEKLETVCKKHGLSLIFDASHAFGCSYGERSIGGFGDLEFLSFHATKFFSSFEGGAVLTNHADIDQKIRWNRNFGFEGYDNVQHLGINGKMSEAAAAMGLASLPAVPRRMANCQRVYRGYCERLSAIPGVSMVPVGEQGKSNYHYIVLIVDEAEYGVSRDTLVSVLWKENVLARKYFYPGCHQMPFYRRRYPQRTWRLPVTERVSQQVLCLPSNLPHPEEDMDIIADIIVTVRKNAKRVQQWCAMNP